MRQVLLYSILLIGGLLVSQWIGDTMSYPIQLLTMIALAFIMIHVGYEFEIDKSRPSLYAWDYVVAATAATFPWFFCALYFVFVMAPAQIWSHPDVWRESLLVSRFASPTSAGVLFSMLAAAGLAGTWVFKKARILAIFDDLDTILLMVPLTFLMVGFRWQLLLIVFLMLLLLWLAWKYLDAIRLPISWPYILGYSALITMASEIVYHGSKKLDAQVPLHLEVLLPAFVVGCVLAPPKRQGAQEHAPDRDEPFHSPHEKLAGMVITAVFMVLVGLSMPPIQAEDTAAEATATELQYQGVSAEVIQQKQAFPGWGMIAFHVLMITLLSNVGKMFPAFCYVREASFRERLATAICMFPRGEVGAGVLVVSLSYGLSGPALTVAVLSLALNLLCTGLFILVVRRLVSDAGQGGFPGGRADNSDESNLDGS